MRHTAAHACVRGGGHRGGGWCIGDGAVGLRRYTRGVPYTPQGTIQDFTSSPRHGSLAEMQRTIDKDAGRPPTGLYNGPTITTADGPRPLFDAAHARHPNRGQAPPGGSRPPPPFLSHFAAPTSSREAMMPPQSDSYQRDLRSDPACADEPEHVLAARQRIMTMQSDSFGESMRGVVAPPPPLDPGAPQAYQQPRVQLDDTWWMLMWSFVALFLIMAVYGK
ncbi:hypothetical protein NESM_000513800 [Novymonas esmeraldas]|uniref:Uncharacterized protein n=1 Tax=Novymonas esmeraldas TaxID=1808958 RepID=A0AAW0EP50_9TRYP